MKTNITCRFCGSQKSGVLFNNWVKPKFTDWDKLLPGDGVCEDCLFFLEERSELLARITNKDKPQRMRNYSHFIKNGEWIPLSKSDKKKMRDLLLTPPFPELAAIAVSGQKHIVFRAVRNPQGCKSGWVQFEEKSVFVHPEQLSQILEIIDQLYVVLTKSEIESGLYKQDRILKFGLDKFLELENKLSHLRGNLLFSLALFLTHSGDDDEQARTEGDGE